MFFLTVLRNAVKQLEYTNLYAHRLALLVNIQSMIEKFDGSKNYINIIMTFMYNYVCVSVTQSFNRAFNLDLRHIVLVI